MEFFIQTRVYLEDSDAQGIVYYVNYLKFMERARTEFLRELGFDFQQLQEQQGHFVVHSLDVRYLKPARVDDNLKITVSTLKAARTYVVFSQKVYRDVALSEEKNSGKDEELLCIGTVKVACVNSDTGRPMAMPTLVANAFSGQCLGRLLEERAE
ncbi:hypothetical protein A9Q81_04770 [Gammaproteobacteria bacterium 42_54_T18]|nr:hypothetical protein A9Q81_04770 [Gammaproteobacteria bacterium 42_54_T18]